MSTFKSIQFLYEVNGKQKINTDQSIVTSECGKQMNEITLDRELSEWRISASLIG